MEIAEYNPWLFEYRHLLQKRVRYYNTNSIQTFEEQALSYQEMIYDKSHVPIMVVIVLKCEQPL